jgi:hypothetical protein
VNVVDGDGDRLRVVGVIDDLVNHLRLRFGLEDDVDAVNGNVLAVVRSQKMLL